MARENLRLNRITKIQVYVIIKCNNIWISKSEALEAFERLGRVMWLSIDVYEDERKIIEGLPLKKGGAADKRG